MNKTLIIINLIVGQLLFSCNPTTPPTVHYISENGSIVLIDDTSAYIANAYIDIFDSVDTFEFKYPMENDTLMRSQIKLFEYFHFDKDFLKNKKIRFSLSLAQKKNNQVFINCDNEIKTTETDSLYKINCAWR